MIAVAPHSRRQAPHPRTEPQYPSESTSNRKSHQVFGFSCATYKKIDIFNLFTRLP